jgi:UDP-N-acetylmuramoylalanine--D-glutamate ligase
LKVQELNNKKVVIIGAARSGVAVAKLVKKAGSIPFVSDSGDFDKLKLFLHELDESGIEYETGKHSNRIFTADFMIISPGVPSNIPIVTKFIESGKEVFSEIEVASWFNKSKLIAVTGSNGKTTTTSLLYEMFHGNNHDSYAAGNIGDPLSNYVLESSVETVGILELSSFQLDHIKTFRPFVSVVMNITPDHLDRYGTFENYINSKGRIFMNQDNNDYLIYNDDDAVVRKLVEKANCKKLAISINKQVNEGAYLDKGKIIIKISDKQFELIDAQKISIQGKHNLYNSLAASIAAYLGGLSKEEICKTLTSFKGVEHRLEFVRELNGIKFYNDSKATNVDSVWYALDSFKVPVNLIAGGKDKGNDYTAIIPLVKDKVKNAVLIGWGAKKLYDSLHEYTNAIFADSMEEAVKKAYELAHSGEVVLLSPACASFDMFNNYEHRGEVFKKIVMSL